MLPVLRRPVFLLTAVVAASGAFASLASAQITATASTVTLNATLPEELTVTVAGASTVNFSLQAGGVTDGDVPVGILTSWILRPNRSTVSVVGYFSSPTQALADGSGNLIPTANVLGQVTTGTPTSFTPFTETNTLGPAGASLTLFDQSITPSERRASRTDNLNLRVDLTSLPQLPAGTYTGTLILQGRAF